MRTAVVPCQYRGRCLALQLVGPLLAAMVLATTVMGAASSGRPHGFCGLTLCDNGATTVDDFYLRLRPGGRPTQMHAYRRMTKKIKRAQNIVRMRQLGHRSFSNKRLQKQLKRVKLIAKDDEWANEFMSFSRPMNTGGDYVMPIAYARNALTEIYGTEPSIQAFQEPERDSYQDEEFDRMERLRRKPRPDQAPGMRPRASTMGKGHVSGVSKYIGVVPKDILTNSGGGSLGVRGGSQQDDYQSVWISGSSVSYDFEAGDW